MITGLYSLILSQPMSLSGWLINLIFVLGFYFLVCWVMSPHRKAYYEEESQIPLNDDSPEERKLFQKSHHKSKHLYRLDA